MTPSDRYDLDPDKPYGALEPRAAQESKPKLATGYMAILIGPFIVLAALGLILSIIAHGYALLGLPQPLGDASWGLHFGIFVVWVPAVFASYRLVSNFKQKDVWRATLRGCPVWMRRMTIGFVVYATINFITFLIAGPAGQPNPNAPAPPIVFRMFSGHWMVFYCAAMATLYSAVVVAQRDPARRCPNGHPVSPGADFCEHCGAKITDSNVADKYATDA